jgi:hypothetical protein
VKDYTHGNRRRTHPLTYTPFGQVSVFFVKVASQIETFLESSQLPDNHKEKFAVDNKGKPNYNLGISKLLIL